MSKISQFTVYSSGDAGAPQLSGTSGSLVTIFDACLVNGYGSKAPAGWDKPFNNLSSSWGVAGSGSVVGCWRNISGSGMTLFINDHRPSSAATFKEAWATGWENMTGMTASVGNGTGQFPTPAQLLTTGHVVIRKSTSVDSTVRNWLMFADAYTFYFYADTGDGYNFPFWFGDFYSIKMAGTDVYRCMIKGRIAENTAASINIANGTTRYSSFHGITTLNPGNQWMVGPLFTVSVGTYAAKPMGGLGSSQDCTTVWDASRCYVYDSTSYNFQVWTMVGVMNTPNNADNSLWIEPLKIGESYWIRGRYRGLFLPFHYGGNLSHGQLLQGSGDYAGKTFMVVKGIENGDWYGNVAVHLLEISNTVETND